MPLSCFDCIVAAVLLTCVPLQYFLVNNWGNVESSRSFALHKFSNRLSTFYNDYLDLSSWKRWVISKLNNKYSFQDSFNEGESPAIEVFQYNNKHGYFSFSPDPRLERPPYVQFHIGQVVMHKTLKYKGVIIGWDETNKAPIDWTIQQHGEESAKVIAMPNYSILVDTKDRLIPQLGYVPQANIKVVEKTQIIHPFLENHFEGFDGDKYIPRPWLKAIYPKD